MMEIPAEIKEKLMTLREAIMKCFGFLEFDGATHRYTTHCCGEIIYGSGCMGPDIIRCDKCKRAIVNVLSPHTSPLLLDVQHSVTAIPSEEFIRAIGERNWMVLYQPSKKSAPA